jgi:hypothetical protein
MQIRIETQENGFKYTVDGESLSKKALAEKIKSKSKFFLGITWSSLVLYIIVIFSILEFSVIFGGLVIFYAFLYILYIQMRPEFIIDSKHNKDVIDKFNQLKNCGWKLSDEHFTVKKSQTGIKFSSEVLSYDKKEKENLKWSLFFLPEFIIQLNPNIWKLDFKFINYKNLKIEYEDTISTDLVGSILSSHKSDLSDTTLLGTTHLYTNQDGSADLRRTNNPELPVFEAAKINFDVKDETPNLEFYFWVSNRSKAKQFVETFSKNYPCDSKISAREDWDDIDFIFYLLAFIATGKQDTIEDKEKTLLITSLKDLFKIDNKDANNRFSRAYNYYLLIRTGITFGDTRQIFSQQFTQLLELMESHFKEDLRNDIYQIAEAIANVDGEIDSMERAFLKAVKQLWSIDKNREHYKSQEIDSAIEIKKFKELLDSGAINEDEYNAKKKELLGL